MAVMIMMMMMMRRLGCGGRRGRGGEYLLHIIWCCCCCCSGDDDDGDLMRPLSYATVSDALLLRQCPTQERVLRVTDTSVVEHAEQRIKAHANDKYVESCMYEDAF